MRTLAVVISLLAAPAIAQERQPDPAPLAGPEVRQVRPDLLEPGLTMGAAPGMAMGQMRQLPTREVRRLLEAMSKDDAPEAIRLTDEQSEAIRAVTREHQATARAFREANAKTIESLRIRGGLIPVRIPDDQLSDDQRGARAELYAFNRQGPTDADLQSRVFAELTDAQRAHLNEAIASLLEARSREQRERRYADELKAQPVDPASFFTDEGTVDLDALPERLRRELAAIDEPQRTNRLRRMLERLSRVQARGPAGVERPVGRKPPPVEAIVVPKPED